MVCVLHILPNLIQECKWVLMWDKIIYINHKLVSVRICILACYENKPVEKDDGLLLKFLSFFHFTLSSLAFSLDYNLSSFSVFISFFLVQHTALITISLLQKLSQVMQQRDRKVNIYTHLPGTCLDKGIFQSKHSVIKKKLQTFGL